MCTIGFLSPSTRKLNSNVDRTYAEEFCLDHFCVRLGFRHSSSSHRGLNGIYGQCALYETSTNTFLVDYMLFFKGTYIHPSYCDRTRVSRIYAESAIKLRPQKPQPRLFSRPILIAWLQSLLPGINRKDCEGSGQLIGSIRQPAHCWLSMTCLQAAANCRVP